MLAIDMMIVFKYLVYFFVMFSDDYGYAIIEYKQFRDKAENLELIKMEASE